MKSAKNIKQSIKKLTVESSDQIHDRILQKVLRKLDQSKRQATLEQANTWRMILKSEIGKVAAALLVISSLTACFVLSQKVTDLRNELVLARQDARVAPVAQTDNTTTINFYLREHQDVVARQASLSPAPPEPMQIQVNQEDILYYELLDGQPDTMYPGIIVRGPLSQGQISPPKEPIISNGHTLSLSEAKETANFNLVAPLRLHPGFELDQIRRIDGRDALQLLYTNAIKSVSLFEQPLDGQRGLEAKDFREYAVYRNAEQAARTILAWRDHQLSYVLIGDVDMSQLMDMAQSISAAR